MEALNGLLYPGTYLTADTGLRLAQLFRRLTLLAPTEQEPRLYAAQLSDYMEIMIETPAPVGDRLSRLNRAIGDWEAWARDMGLGQGTSTEAILQSASLARDESIGEIIESLRGGTAEDPLLEAQLFLRLAADVDRREDDMRTDLAEVETQQGRLRAILSGSGPSEPLLFPVKSADDSMIPPLSRPKERLKAWARLWRAGKTPGISPVGTSISVKDMMDEAYEALNPVEAAVELLSLPLPLDSEMRPGCDARVAEALQRLTETLLGTDSTPGPAAAATELAREIAARWSQAIGLAPTGPHIGLTLYPSRTWEEIISKAAGLKDTLPEGNKTAGFSFYLF